MHHPDLQELPCITLDAGGAITGWNAEWAAALGDTDLSGLRPWLELLHAQPGAPASAADDRVAVPVGAGVRSMLFQPLLGTDGALLQWLGYLLPLPVARSHRELIEELPLRSLIKLGSNLFFVVDDEGNLVLWNRRVEDTAGRAADALRDSAVSALFAPADRALVAQQLGLVLQCDAEIKLEAHLATPAGIVPYMIWGSRLQCEGRNYMVSMGIDISQRRQDEQTLRLRERALHASTNGIVITRVGGADNLIEYVNPAFEAMTGYSAAEVMGRDSRFMAAPGVDQGERDRLRDAIREQRGHGVVFRNRRKNGEIFWNELSVTPVADERGTVTHFVGVLNDVTASKQRTTTLEHEVNHDALTGLANRNLLWDRIGQALYLAQRNKSLVAIVLIDLNKFKDINDSLGHDAGDEVLKVVARRLQAAVRESDTVARLSGDEFVLVLSNQPSLRYTLRMVQRVHASLAKAVMFEGREVSVSGSIGVSLYPHDASTPFDLVRAADTAMYHAKAAGGRDVHFFSAAMKSSTEAKQKMESDLRYGIARDQLFLMFQPRICLHTGGVCGVDALLRWRHPELGVLLPTDFLADAEENGLIVPLGQWVLERVCHTLQRLKALGFPHLPLSMKCAYREFVQENFVANIGERLAAFQVAPACLELDLREVHLMRNPHLGSTLARQSAELGIRLGVDDVGDGESNLAYLHHLPLHHIRMGHASVRDISAAAGSGALARSIIGLGHNLNVRVIAKGVETPRQRDFLAAQGCDEMEGHFFSVPVEQGALEQMLGALAD
jgi:diguanylate cyclase (GGDEF)-like protein/PAS domain S-box-containing protein